MSLLFAQDSTGYFVYKVLPGQTFSSIASSYNITAGELASYNNLDFYPGPLISVTLKIPLKSTPAITNNKAAVKKEANAKKVEVQNNKKTAILPAVKDTVITNTTKADSITPQPLPVADTVKPAAYAQVLDTVIKPLPVQASEKITKSPDLFVRKSWKVYIPWLIFLTASIILLVAAIYFYRAVKK